MRQFPQLLALHDSGMISREPEASFGNLNMDFAGEADALQKLI